MYKEPGKIDVISKTNAVPQPWAMMIKTTNTTRKSAFFLSFSLTSCIDYSDNFEGVGKFCKFGNNGVK